MNYLDIVHAHTLPERQRSLFSIIAAAQMAANEAKDRVSILHAPIYVDEFVESEHVFCPSVAVPVLYPERKGVPYSLDAIVEPSGSVYFLNRDDLLLVLMHTKPEQRRVSISIEDGQ
jgi:hypothetical protein